MGPQNLKNFCTCVKFTMVTFSPKWQVFLAIVIQSGDCHFKLQFEIFRGIFYINYIKKNYYTFYRKIFNNCATINWYYHHELKQISTILFLNLQFYTVTKILLPAHFVVTGFYET